MLKDKAKKTECIKKLCLGDETSVHQKIFLSQKESNHLSNTSDEREEKTKGSNSLHENLPANSFSNYTSITKDTSNAQNFPFKSMAIPQSQNYFALNNQFSNPWARINNGTIPFIVMNNQIFPNNRGATFAFQQRQLFVNAFNQQPFQQNFAILSIPINLNNFKNK